MYVTDQSNTRVEVFDSSGKYASTIILPQLYPVGIALDSSNNIYVTEQNKHSVLKFTSSGQTLASWGGSGTDDGKFDTPSGIAIDKNDYVYVADTNNARIEKFTSDGQFLTKWGSNGTDNGKFLTPTGIAVDSAGNVYVTDSNPYNSSIQKFSIQNQTEVLTGPQKSVVPEFGATTPVILTDAILTLLIFRVKSKFYH